MKPLKQLAAWWRSRVTSPSSPTTYRLDCPCGQACQGQRQLRQQVIRCTHCQRELFVLPLSPLPAVRLNIAPQAVAPSTRRRVWLVPLLAGGLTFLVAIAVFAALWDRIIPTHRPSAGGTRPLGTAEQRLVIGRKALQIGDFRLALEELNAAQALFLADPQCLPADERRQLLQLHRQAALLVDWPKDSLEQILSRLAPLRDDEWQTVIAKYQAKAFVFDLEVRRDAGRQYQVRFTRPPGRLMLRLDLQNLLLFQHLPLENPQRVWFAARLAEVKREAADRCLIQLDPNGAVLLTDVNPTVLGAQVPDTQLVLQRKWCTELP